MGISKEAKREYYYRKARGLVVVASKKKYKFKGFKVIVETFDKHHTRVFTIDGLMRVKYTKEIENFKLFESIVKQWVYEWMGNKQNVYEPKNYILIIDTKDTKQRKSNINNSLIGFQLTLKQKRLTEFSETLKVVEPQLSEFYNVLLDTANELGFTVI